MWKASLRSACYSGALSVESSLQGLCPLSRMQRKGGWPKNSNIFSPRVNSTLGWTLPAAFGDASKSPQVTVSMETDLGSLPWRSLFKLPSLTPTIMGIRKRGPLRGFSSLLLPSSAVGFKTHQPHSEIHLLVIAAGTSEHRISILILAHLFILCSAHS